VQRGYAPAGNFHTARLETAPLGHFFHVISNGYGAMPDYSAQIVPADRWAIVAYIKALQLSQKATQGDVGPGGHVEPLSSIAEEQGLPASFADEWTLPPTAVHGTPDAQQFNAQQFHDRRSSTCRRTAGNSIESGSFFGRTNRTEAVTSEASERRLETHGIWTRT
jgi:hypothetical protein